MNSSGRRRAGWLWWIGVVVALIVGAFVAGSRVETPWTSAEANAERGTIATATVTLGSVSTPVPSVVGVLSTGSVLDVVPAASEDAGRLVVTALRVSPGESVGSGRILALVSGRPVITLVLPFPLYRDLHPGDEGADVVAVQGALAALGLYAGPIDGEYGSATGRAVAALYVSCGATPPEALPEAVASVEEAESALDAARAAADTGSSDVVPGTADAVASASRALDEARRLAGPWLPMSEVAALPGDSARVSATTAVGSILAPDTPVVSLRVGAPEVTVRVGLADTWGVVEGSSVSVALIGDATSPTSGTIRGVSEFRQGSGDGTLIPGYDVRVELSEDPGWADQSSVAVSPTGMAEETSGLLVPLTAIGEDADGTFVIVLVLQDDGSLSDDEIIESPRSRVSVQLGSQSDGYVAVRGDLREGDIVVVGES